MSEESANQTAIGRKRSIATDRLDLVDGGLYVQHNNELIKKVHSAVSLAWGN